MGAKGSTRNARFLDRAREGWSCGCGGLGLDRRHGENRFLCRLFRPRDQRPSGRGAPGRAAVRPAGAGGRHPPGQDPAVPVRGAARDVERDLRRNCQGGRHSTHLRDVRRSRDHGGAARGRLDPDPRPARRHRLRLRDADGRDERHHGAGDPDGLPAREPGGASDYRHAGAPDRQDGGRRHGLRAGAGRGPAEGEIFRKNR